MRISAASVVAGTAVGGVRSNVGLAAVSKESIAVFPTSRARQGARPSIASTTLSTARRSSRPLRAVERASAARLGIGGAGLATVHSVVVAIEEARSATSSSVSTDASSARHSGNVLDSLVALDAAVAAVSNVSVGIGGTPFAGNHTVDVARVTRGDTNAVIANSALNTRSRQAARCARAAC